VRLKPDQKIQLFDLRTDFGEQKDVAGEHPDVAARAEEIFRTGRTDSEAFPLQRARPGRS
jgi:hypothetical protein